MTHNKHSNLINGYIIYFIFKYLLFKKKKKVRCKSNHSMSFHSTQIKGFTAKSI